MPDPKDPPKAEPGANLAVVDPVGEYLARLRATILGIEPFLVEQFMLMARSRNYMPGGRVSHAEMLRMAARLHSSAVSLMLCAQQIRRDCGEEELN